MMDTVVLKMLINYLYVHQFPFVEMKWNKQEKLVITEIWLAVLIVQLILDTAVRETWDSYLSAHWTQFVENPVEKQEKIAIMEM